MKHVISIGIDSAEGLTPLNAAVSGAKEFDTWAKTQGYSSLLFVDEQNPVLLNDIFDAIKKIVDDRNCEQLIIYFAGHGILLSPSQEIWLLSNATNNPNESINLTGSTFHARTSGIPYILFVSDACRLITADFRLTGNGSEIFPIKDDVGNNTAIDIMYATRAGNPANEYNSQTNAEKFGLFTKSLLEHLEGKFPDVIVSQQSDDTILSVYYDVERLKGDEDYKTNDSGWSVSSIEMEDSVTSAVEQMAMDINISLNQSPQFLLQHQSEKPSLASFNDEKAKELLLNAAGNIRSGTSTKPSIFEGMMDMATLSRGDTADTTTFDSVIENFEVHPDATMYNSDSLLLESSRRIYNARGRNSFETRTGFSIIGADIDEVFVHQYRSNPFKDNEITHIRVHDDNDLTSALIVLNTGQSIPVAILNGYIGTLVFHKGQLQTINYTPSQGTAKFHAYENNRKQIELVRAFVASAAFEGFDYQKVFEKEFDSSGYLNNAGSFIRREKSIDPSLGLYAVYAYMQSGRKRDIKSVFKYMNRESTNMLYDVANLADELNFSSRPLAPFCPMLSLGWTYSRFKKQLHPEIVEASKYLVPALWTTFNRQGTEILISLFKQNKIR